MGSGTLGGGGGGCRFPSPSYQDDIDGCAETADSLHLQDRGLQLLSVGQPEQHQGH
jgi:hypothetical protein